jgi:hypothetical protein
MCDCCDYVAANAGRATEDELRDEYDRSLRRRIRALIDEGSWLVTTVEEWPWLTHTVGLWSRGHAELCVFGLEPPKGQGLLNAVGEQIRDGLRIDDEDEVLIGTFPLLAFRLPEPGKVVLAANRFYRRKPARSVPALQLVYPDVHGVWPWEADCHLFPGSQPMPGEFDATADPESA